MRQYDIHEVKKYLSALVEKAAAGEPFIIAKAGHPLVTVTAISHAPSRPRTGFLKGQISVPEDFDSMGNEKIEALFEGTL